MPRISFDLALNVTELINVPLLKGNRCFLIVTVSGRKITNNYKRFHRSKITTASAQIKNHKCVFGKAGQVHLKARIRVGSASGRAAKKWLSVSFMIEGENTKEPFRLGAIYLNLADYLSQDKPAMIKYLLDHSKTNSIAKLSVGLQQSAGAPDILYQVPEELTAGSSSKMTAGITRTLHRGQSAAVFDTETNTDTSSLVSPVKSGCSACSPLEDRPQTDGLDPRSVKSVCDEVFSEDDILNKVLNHTYRLTWESLNGSHVEFSPLECVRDIVEYNGNGWKRNEEGLSVPDVLRSEMKEYTRRKVSGRFAGMRPHNIASSYFDDGNSPAMSEDELSDDAGDISSELSDFASFSSRFDFQGWSAGSGQYGNARAQKAKKIRRFTPPTEFQVRSDLRSWSID
mgnify:CR=1 FL=1